MAGRVFLSGCVLAVLLAVAAVGCSGEGESRGFVLPAGSAERGQEVFAKLQCNACHTVKGIDLPAPVADPPVGVELGGIILKRRTDGELVTAIIAPSHEISTRWAAGVMDDAGGQSRMADFSELMTVRDLVDVVAFLQSQYEVQPGSDYSG
jgi:mono/diheme cytochrome c family protein